MISTSANPSYSSIGAVYLPAYLSYAIRLITRVQNTEAPGRVLVDTSISFTDDRIHIHSKMLEVEGKDILLACYKYSHYERGFHESHMVLLSHLAGTQWTLFP